MTSAPLAKPAAKTQRKNVMAQMKLIDRGSLSK